MRFGQRTQGRKKDPRQTGRGRKPHEGGLLFMKITTTLALRGRDITQNISATRLIASRGEIQLKTPRRRRKKQNKKFVHREYMLKRFRNDKLKCTNVTTTGTFYVKRALWLLSSRGTHRHPLLLLDVWHAPRWGAFVFSKFNPYIHSNKVVPRYEKPICARGGSPA